LRLRGRAPREPRKRVHRTADLLFFEILLADDGSDLEGYDDQIEKMEAKIESNATGQGVQRRNPVAQAAVLLIVRNYYEQLLDNF
jgi:hypothetical protein